MPGAKHLRIHFIKPLEGKAEVHAESERKYWLPLHRELEKQGAFAGWMFGRLRFPSANERPYGSIAVNFFKDWSQAENHYAKADPAKLQEATAAMEGLAEHVRVELWSLVEQTDPR
jgi:hypothetical protein